MTKDRPYNGKKDHGDQRDDFDVESSEDGGPGLLGRHGGHGGHGGHAKHKAHDDDEGEHHGGGGGGHESDEFLWLFSFNDMLFNLLLFFIVMFAISSVNKSRFEAVAEAINYPKDKKEQEKNQPLLFKRDNVEVSLNDIKSNDVYVECANPVLPPKDSSPGVEGGEAKGLTQQQFAVKPEEQFRTRAIVLSGNEFFRPGLPDPTAEGLRFVKRLATRYKGNKSLVQVQVEGYGYGDEFGKPTGSFGEDSVERRAWALSAQRAAAMLSLMVEEGFDPQISSIAGFGPGSREQLGHTVKKVPQNPSAVGPDAVAKQLRPKIIIRMTESLDVGRP